MKGRHRILRAFVSASLAVLLVIAVTPKLYLHHAFARHEDAASSTKAVGKPQLHAPGYHCQVDHVVVELPFLPAVQEMPAFSTSSITFVYASQLVGKQVAPLFTRTLRGPPVVC